VINRQYLGSWDFRAFKWISEYLMGLKLDICMRVEEHISGAGPSHFASALVGARPGLM
jgi:hypothetical protein